MLFFVISFAEKSKSGAESANLINVPPAVVTVVVVAVFVVLLITVIRK